MSKKHTIEFVKAELAKEGYILVSTKYVNNSTPLKYVCPKGHPGSICWGSWNNKSRCAKCYGVKKLTINFIREQFEKEGYILTSKEYVNNYTKLDYICPKKHEGNITWSDWSQGCRCRKCYEKKVSKRMSGKNHPMFGKCGKDSIHWNPSLTDEDRQDTRKYLEYTVWRKGVFEKANYTCEVCGDKIGGNLEAHHKNSYDNNPEQRTLLENGACVCECCHKNFHHQYGYGDNTEEQFLEFKENN